MESEDDDDSENSMPNVDFSRMYNERHLERSSLMDDYGDEAYNPDRYFQRKYQATQQRD